MRGLEFCVANVLAYLMSFFQHCEKNAIRSLPHVVALVYSGYGVPMVLTAMRKKVKILCGGHSRLFCVFSLCFAG